MRQSPPMKHDISVKAFSLPLWAGVFSGILGARHLQEKDSSALASPGRMFQSWLLRMAGSLLPPRLVLRQFLGLTQPHVQIERGPGAYRHHNTTCDSLEQAVASGRVCALPLWKACSLNWHTTKRTVIIKQQIYNFIEFYHSLFSFLYFKIIPAPHFYVWIQFAACLICQIFYVKWFVVFTNTSGFTEKNKTKHTHTKYCNMFKPKEPKLLTANEM